MSIDNDTLLAIVAICLKRKEYEKKKKRKKRQWMKDIHKARPEFTYQNLLDELKVAPKNDFRHFFANDASIYEELLNLLGPLIKKQDTIMREAIPVSLRLSTTLRYLVTGGYFENMRASSAMSPNTISAIVLETCEAIIFRLRDYIKLPDTQDDWKAIAKGFYENFNFPNCLGAVAGKHIAIPKPSGRPYLYYNHKKFFSVVLMAVINSNYEFIAADVNLNESISGGEDFFQTSFGQAIYGNGLYIPNSEMLCDAERELPFVFVGDSTFQLTKHLMKPYPLNGLTKGQKIYNHRLSRVHQVAENTFGALFSQFGVFQKPINLAPEKVKTIVVACCYLYNFLRRKTKHHLWDSIFDKENLEDGRLMEGSWRDIVKFTSLQTAKTKTVSGEAENVRENFKQFFNKEGEVSWQYRMV